MSNAELTVSSGFAGWKPESEIRTCGRLLGLTNRQGTSKTHRYDVEIALKHHISLLGIILQAKGSQVFIVLCMV